MRKNLSSHFQIRQSIFQAAWLPCIACLLAAPLTNSPVHGHDEFKEALEQRYRLKSVSCKACHTDNKDKKIRNAFGKLLHNELKDKKITQQYRDAKAKGEKAEEKFEKQMVKEFVVALKAVEQKPVTFLSLLEAGLLNGMRLDKNQVDVDELTIKTLSDDEVKSITIDGKNVIKGEIRRMPPAEDKTGKSEKQSTPAGAQNDKKDPSKPDSGSPASGSKTEAEPPAVEQKDAPKAE